MFQSSCGPSIGLQKDDKYNRYKSTKLLDKSKVTELAKIIGIKMLDDYIS